MWSSFLKEFLEFLKNSKMKILVLILFLNPFSGLAPTIEIKKNKGRLCLYRGFCEHPLWIDYMRIRKILFMKQLGIGFLYLARPSAIFLPTSFYTKEIIRQLKIFQKQKFVFIYYNHEKMEAIWLLAIATCKMIYLKFME